MQWKESSKKCIAGVLHSEIRNHPLLAIAARGKSGCRCFINTPVRLDLLENVSSFRAMKGRLLKNFTTMFD